MKVVAAIMAALSLTLAGCSKPPAGEYLKKAQDAEKGGLWTVAIENYQNLVRDHPNDPLAENAMFNVATIQNNSLHDFPAAVNQYKTFLRTYPDSKKAATATFLVAFLYNNDVKNLDSARVYYQMFLSRYPTNEMASSAQFELENLGKSPDEFIPKAAVVEAKPEAPAKKSAKPGKH
jgi:TolA-binding protein